MADFLTDMAATSRERADRANAADLAAMVASVPKPATLNLSGQGFDLITEAKLESPSEGVLDGTTDATGRVVELANTFASAGAAAISVLTEPLRFGGHLDHLRAAASLDTPVMRKDFIVDPVQVTEARAMGASGLLLIARITGGGLLEEMTDLALSHGMFVLVEVFDHADIEKASVIFDRDVLVGVNTRDLSTLQVDPNRLADLATDLPDHLPLVAESGINTPDDAVKAVNLGYSFGLVGTALVKSSSPAELATSMIDAGRSVGVEA